MPLNIIVRQKRKEMGLTQEQVAEYLGVTAPAVNKWEKGATYPDIATLPALARLLKTDLNILLGFEEGLSKQEVESFMKQIMDTINAGGFAEGFDVAMKKIHEYPGCIELIYPIAAMLDGMLMLSSLGTEQKAQYEVKILKWYEVVADSESDHQRNAAYILAARFIQQENYERAREMIERIPEYSVLDRRKLEADILVKQGKTQEAAVFVERKLLTSLNEVQMLIISLIHIAVQEGQTQVAKRLADLSGAFIRLFELWEYSAYVAPLTVALAQHDEVESMEMLEKLFNALFIPWNMHDTLLYRHIPTNGMEVPGFGAKALPGVLSELENDTKYDFLREKPEFRGLIKKYAQRVK